MFNQRPNTLLGLETRHDSSELINFLSPLISTPDQYIKYFDYFQTRERAYELNETGLAPTTPTSLTGVTSSNSKYPSSVIGIPSANSNYHHEHQQIDQQQYHALTTPLQPAPQQPQSQSQSQPQPQPQPQLQLQLQLQPQLHPQPLPHLQPQQLEPQPINTKTPVCSDALNVKVDDERIRNKRERNRKAAANCRRRKEERLRMLEEENSDLRKTIENLQATISSMNNHRINL